MSLAVTGMNHNVLVGTDVVDENYAGLLNDFGKIMEMTRSIF